MGVNVVFLAVFAWQFVPTLVKEAQNKLRLRKVLGAADARTMLWRQGDAIARWKVIRLSSLCCFVFLRRILSNPTPQPCPSLSPEKGKHASRDHSGRKEALERNEVMYPPFPSPPVIANSGRYPPIVADIPHSRSPAHVTTDVCARNEALEPANKRACTASRSTAFNR